MTPSGSTGSSWPSAATATIGEARPPRILTTRCSIVSGPKRRSALDVPMRLDLPPHNTMPPLTPGLKARPTSLGAMRREQTAAAEAHLLRRDAAGGDFDGAVLELRDLPEWIEHRVREHVRGGFVVAERNEHRAARLAFVRARVERDAAAARRNRQRPAWRDTQLVEIQRMHRRNRLRLDVVERRRSARHRSGVPVLELA